MDIEKRIDVFRKSGFTATVCRLCFEEIDRDFISLSNKGGNSYLLKLKVVLLETYAEDNNFPSQLCKSCGVNLNLVYELIMKWKETQSLLINMCASLRENNEATMQNIKTEEEYWDTESKEIKIELDEFMENYEKSDLGLPDEAPLESKIKGKKRINNGKTVSNGNKCGTHNIGEGETIICHICSKPLKTHNSLAHHIEHMHGKARFQKVGTVTGFGVDRRYHCMYCDYKAKNTRTLTCHIRVHTGEKPFRCDVCNKYFTSYAGLYQHKNVHSSVMNHTCFKCGKQFNTKRNHERHQMVHVEEKKFICDICNKALKNKTSLELHIQRHNNIKNFSCETCGAMFVSCSELIGHAKTHNSIKRLHCNICNFSTNVKSHLEVHLLRHSGLRPHECKLCPVKCYTKSSLSVHMRTHNREKKYFCSFCEKSFSHSTALNKHVFKCHGVKYKWSDEVDRRVIK